MAAPRKHWSAQVRRIVILVINVLSTMLTLFSGLRENPLIVFVTGRYDLLRFRLSTGAVNYNIAQDDLFNVSTMPNLIDASKNFRFYSTPKRGPDTGGTGANSCIWVNSMAAPYMTLDYDDYWGTGARRAQIVMYSISAPHCDTINFNYAWAAECVESYGGNATQCHEYILANFDDLKTNRKVRVADDSGFAVLRCQGRPMLEFPFTLDQMMFQQYWAGGSWHLELQTSNCLASPLAMADNWDYGLYNMSAADPDITVVSGSDDTGWFSTIVAVLYGFVSVIYIVRGVVAAIVRSSTVIYVPDAFRFPKYQRLLRYIFPSMELAAIAPESTSSVIRFKGKRYIASDVWMNNWLFMVASMLDAVVNVRMNYAMFEMATWLLSMWGSTTHFLFLCSALTRLTWVTCFVHTVVRLGCKLALRGMRKLKNLPRGLCAKLEWYVDATALFVSFKVYSILFAIILYFFLKVYGLTTLMVQISVPHVYGNAPNIHGFWQSEIMCDYVTFISILFACAMFLSSALLLTPYRHVPDNGVIRLIQSRYVMVGWDAMSAMDALGIDPADPANIKDGVAMTSCSIGSLLQQLYNSAPSGFVHLAGDYIFEQGGFMREPFKFTYPIQRAGEMGLSGVRVGATSAQSKKYRISTAGEEAMSTAVHDEHEHHAAGLTLQHKDNKPLAGNTISLFDKRLRICSEGVLGRVLLVDDNNPGKVSKNATSSMMEYIVEDALTHMTILDIKPLLKNDKKLRIV